MKILVIDNYDSFTYNLVQLLGVGKNKVIVKRNDEINIREIIELEPEKILLSPGPGRPEKAGISSKVVKKLGGKIPVLGVCLGHQVIGEAFGAKIINTIPVHGKTSEIIHDGKTIFKNIPQNFTAMRYHSLIIDSKLIPQQLEISATTKDGLIMGLRYKDKPIESIQFHPESILTKEGKNIINNWLMM